MVLRMSRFNSNVDDVPRTLSDTITVAINYFHFHRNFGEEVKMERVDGRSLTEGNIKILDSFVEKHNKLNKGRRMNYQLLERNGNGYRRATIFES